MTHPEHLHRRMTAARAAGQLALADEIAARIAWIRTGDGPLPPIRLSRPHAELYYVPEAARDTAH